MFKSLSHSALLNCFVRLGVGYFLHLITFTHFYFLFFLNNHFYCTLALLPQMLKPSKCDFAPGRAPWHLQVGMLSCFLMLAMFCKAITRKAFAKRCVGTTNLKASCARENLPKPFWLICWSILFLLSQQIFTLQQSLVFWQGCWGSLWSLNVFPLSLLQMLQSKQAPGRCKRMNFWKFSSVSPSFARLVV